MKKGRAGIERDLKPRVIADGHWLTAHPGNRSWLLQANDHNYLYVRRSGERCAALA